MIRKGWLSLLLVATFSGALARADWSVDLFGPHGRVSFGDRDYVEYGDAGSYGGYHDVLDGYGRWVYLPGSGECWIPSVTASWRPYTYGRWVWCDYGWTWVSYEPWGYFPHHYGDWRYVGSYGWCWVPGYTWRPANVTFCHRGGYVGWYPAGAFVNIDIDINIYNHVNFVRTADFTNGRLDRVLVAAGRNSPIHQIARGFVGSRKVVSAPPSIRAIEGAARAKVERVSFDERQVKVGGRNLKVVAPKGNARTSVLAQAREVAPKVVTKAERRGGASPAKDRGTPSARTRPEGRDGKGTIERHGRPAPREVAKATPPRQTRPKDTHDRGTVSRRGSVKPEPRTTPREAQGKVKSPRKPDVASGRDVRPRESAGSVRKSPSPRESVRTPKQTPRESVRTPKQTPRESVRTPKQAPRESVRTPKQAPRESSREGKSKKAAPSSDKPSDKDSSADHLKGPRS